jgi:hypothetical protein
MEEMHPRLHSVLHEEELPLSLLTCTQKTKQDNDNPTVYNINTKQFQSMKKIQAQDHHGVDGETRRI